MTREYEKCDKGPDLEVQNAKKGIFNDATEIEDELPASEENEEQVW